MERSGYRYHKLHIYLYPFYYINYALTTMGAMEFKKRSTPRTRQPHGRIIWVSAKLAAAAAISKRCTMRTCLIPLLPAPSRACGYAENILLDRIAKQAQ